MSSEYPYALTEEQITELKEKHGDFWQFSDEFLELTDQAVSTDYITTTTRRGNLQKEMAVLLKHMNRNNEMQIFLHEQYLKIQKLLNEHWKNETGSAEDTTFSCVTEWQNGHLQLHIQQLLPRLEKVMTLEAYQQLREFYIPHLSEQLLKVRPAQPLQEVLVFIRQYTSTNRSFDPDNRFRSFILDSLVRSGIIQDDSIKNVMMLEKNELCSMRRWDGYTEVYIVPYHDAFEFINGLKEKSNSY
ncbi:RusA family crossover junction endodeoxyribonuclease [Salibacterium aidingense]|uniref:hypothetical protein n=1 Tax=Salibacterium aidingense TaxID=384933 RepID=UPI0004100CFB|nr:hypothetical protein [Salibacterium aidingense]